jgi:hypothetical protein
MWCVIRANHIIGPIFYEWTLDAQRYINEILNPFFVNLVPAEERFGYLIQDGMAPHTAKESIRALCSVFGELMGRIELLTRVCWPPRSPDHIPCDFYLWRKLKSVVCQQSTWHGGHKTEYSWSNLQHSATWIATSFTKSV